MNKWLYRAVGTVGVAGGILLLGAGAAQAGEAERAEPQLRKGMLDELFSPTAGLPDLALPVVAAPAQDRAEVLPSLPIPVTLPLVGDLGSVLDGLPLSSLGGLPGIPLGLDSLNSLTSPLVPRSNDVSTQPAADLGPLGLPRPNDADLLRPAIADQLAAQGFSPDLFDHPDATRNAELLPVGGGLAGVNSLADTVLGTLPLDSLGLDALPVTGLATVGGRSLGNLSGAPKGAGPKPATLPLADGLPMTGPLITHLTTSVVDTLPTSGLAAAPQLPASAPASTRPAPTGVRPGERPVAGEDPEFAEPAGRAESAEMLPTDALTSVLPLAAGGLSGVPVSGLTQQLPLVGELPVVGSLPAGLAVLRSMPVVGLVPGLLPIS